MTLSMYSLETVGIAELLNSWDLVSNALQRLITRDDNTLSRERRLSGNQCKTASDRSWPAGARGAGADCQRVLSTLC
jgi:hypothetical protein